MFEVVDLWGLAFSDDGHSVFASVSTGAQAFSFKFTALRACKIMTYGITTGKNFDALTIFG